MVMNDPSSYDALVQQYLRQLKSKRPADRRAAAYALGELAAAEAIDPLLSLYQSDADAGVRKAAEYALGMFRAVHREMKQGEDHQEYVTTLLEGIVDAGLVGSRAPVGKWVRRIVALAVSLVVLLGAASFLPSLLPDGGVSVSSLLPASAASSKATVVEGVRINFNKVRDDVNTLQSQFLAVAGGRALDCAAFFNNVPAFTLSNSAANAYPDLPPIVSQINSALTVWQTAYARYDSACFGGIELPPGEIGTMLAALRPALDAIQAAEAGLTAVESDLTPPTAAPAPPTEAAPITQPDAPPTNPPAVDVTAQPGAPTLEPTIEPPTATPLPEVRPHVAALFTIIDNVTNPRGQVSLLKQYWNDGLTRGQTDGCVVNLEIPSLYALPTDVAELSRELTQATALINGALEETRNSYFTFRGACASRQLRQQSQAGVETMLRVENALRQAQELLRQVR